MKSIVVPDSSPQSSWGQVIALEKRFEPMVAKLEHLAERDADGYRRKVVIAGLLGYGVLGGTILLFLGLCILMLALMLMTGYGFAGEARGFLIFGLIAIALVRALWVTNPEPEGIVVKEQDAPGLFAVLGRIRAATGGPAVHDVRMTGDMNAAITQDFRFFIFGSRNRLLIGLPLLMAMTAPEIEAIIAHESGHFVGMHGRSAGFAYRIRRRWSQAAERLPTGIVASVMRRFFTWYGPWFASYSFVLARQQEYEADRVAARIIGAQTAADALLRVTLQAERFGQAWGTLWKRSALGDDPPRSPYREVAAALRGENPADASALRRALASGPALDDTHPTLAQRLQALGEAPRIPPPLDEPAAGVLLTDAGEHFVEQLDAQWHEWCDESWAADYVGWQEERAERDALHEEISAGERDRDKLFRHAWLTERIDGAGPAAAAYAAVVEHHPDAHDALFRRGDTLLDSGDETGIAVLIEAGKREAVLMPHAYRRIIDFLIAEGREGDAQAYFSPLAEADRREALASAEARSLDESVALRPLDAETRDRLSALRSTVVGIKSLHAAFRDLEHREKPQIVFLFEPEKGLTGQEALDALIEALLPAGDLLGIQRTRNRNWLAKRIETFPLSRIG